MILTLGIPNPSTRKVETGVICLGVEGNKMQKETGTECSMRFGGNRCTLRTGQSIGLSIGKGNGNLWWLASLLL